MVVVSDSWMKNVATFPTPVMSEMEMIITNNESKMVAKAVLICRQNSHPFQDRTLTLAEPVKIGRSVARARAKPNNAIFDCKVLSRNHAVLWYENGKFFLQDTKSSNGTFVNNNKLTPETENHEVSSGDIVQFGVDVVENNRKVTHGCIIATLKLYLPDGKEAKASPSISEGSRHGMVPLDELYRLNQIIQEASDREECLQKKLVKLQSMLQTAKLATSTCWAAYVGEERLLSRIATLETQLSQASKNWTEDRCKQELNKIQDENVAYQVAAIEALEKLHTEKLDAVAYVTELEIKENAIQQDANLAKMQVDSLQRQLEELLQKLMEEQKKTDGMRADYEAKLQDLQVQLDDKLKELTALESKLNINIKTSNNSIIEDLEVKSDYIYTEDDVKLKREMLEYEEQEHLNNISSEDLNHITLTVGPVKDEIPENDKDSISEQETNSLNSDVGQYMICHESDDAFSDISTSDKGKLRKDVKFNLPEDGENKDSEDTELNEKSQEEEESDEEKENELVDHIDSKTLKYHFQSTQNELKKRIEALDTLCKSNQCRVEELEAMLTDQKKAHAEVEADNEVLKEELRVYRDNLEKSSRENRDLKNEVNSLLASNIVGAGDTIVDDVIVKEQTKLDEKPPNGRVVSYEELVSVEEELVLLKERFSKVNEDKVSLQRDVDGLRKQYNSIRSQSHNMTFFYVAPLVLIVLYLLLSNVFS